MKKGLKIISLKDKQSDYKYWLTKSYQERIDAIELLRLQFINYSKNAQQRFQRVCSVINQKQS
jgi:hypothetical protein